MALIDDNFHISGEGIAVSSIAMEIGCVNTEIIQGSNQASSMQAEKAQCECCRHEEECTPAYIAHVRRLYYGRWICGLCAEAVKEEHRRVGGGESGLEGALEEHMQMCTKFKRPAVIGSPIADISKALRRLLQRSAGARITSRSEPSSPSRRMALSRANSCYDSFPQGSKASI